MTTKFQLKLTGETQPKQINQESFTNNYWGQFKKNLDLIFSLMTNIWVQKEIIGVEEKERNPKSHVRF